MLELSEKRKELEENLFLRSFFKHLVIAFVFERDQAPLSRRTTWSNVMEMTSLDLPITWEHRRLGKHLAFGQHQLDENALEALHKWKVVGKEGEIQGTEDALPY